MHRLLPLLALPVLLLGCASAVQQTGDPAPNYLQLAAYVSVDRDAGSLEGFLRWIYQTDDPVAFDDPRPFCEVWEHLDLGVVDLDPACGGCTDQFEGTAAVLGEPETTCDGVDWSDRPFTLTFGPLDLIEEPDRATLEEDGFTHGAQTRWSPDLGSSEGFQPLFAATPDQWEPDAGEAGSAETIDGQYELFCRYYWDVRDSDVP